MIWPVFYWDWQYECCGEPFGVGHVVSWPLLASPGGEPWMPDAWLVAPLADGRLAGHRAVFADGLAAYLAPAPAPTRAGVMLCEEHHGGVPEDFPETRGIVRRLRVASVVFRRGHGVPGTAELREVDIMPDAFHGGSGAEVRNDVGVLVDLEPVADESQ